MNEDEMELHEQLKKNAPLKILGIFLIVVSFIFMMFLAIAGQMENVTIGFLPLFSGLYFLVRWRFAKDLPEPKWKMLLQEILFSGCFGVAFFFFLVVAYMIVMMTPVRSVLLYQPVMLVYNDAVFDFFPDKIPQNATEKKFYAQHAFLQGGTTLQMKMKLPPEDIQELLQEFDPLAIYTLTDVEGWYKGAYSDEIFTMPYLTNENKSEHHFPETFKILTFFVESYDENWNHATMYGVAIDEENSIIVYFFEAR